MVTIQLLITMFSPASSCKVDHTIMALLSNNCEWLDVALHLLLVAGWSFSAVMQGSYASSMQVRSLRTCSISVARPSPHPPPLHGRS